MGYPNFGKVKTLVLPVPDTEMSLREYQEKYGIDLTDIVAISGNVIKLKNGLPNTAVYIDDIQVIFSNIRLNTLKSVSGTDYAGGSTDGTLDLVYVGNTGSGEAIRIIAPKDKELSFENLLVQAMEY